MPIAAALGHWQRGADHTKTRFMTLLLLRVAKRAKATRQTRMAFNRRVFVVWMRQSVLGAGAVLLWRICVQRCDAGMCN